MKKDDHTDPKGLLLELLGSEPGPCQPMSQAGPSILSRPNKETNHSENQRKEMYLMWPL